MAITNADGSIVLTTKVDTSGLKKGMSTMKSGVSSLIGSFSKLAPAIGIAFGVGALVKFSKEASNLATTTEASVQRLIDIYGSASKAVRDFIYTNAQVLGMSKAAAASYASVYGNLFSVWADQETNAELTNRYLNMTAVVASKTGRTVEDVQERIRSGLLGNTEAIEDLGIFVNVKTIEMTDAFKRMANGKSWEQLDAYTQQQIRSMAILEQATAKYGDEVAKTTALTKAQFQAAWQDFQATWGQVVNRVLMPVLEILTEILVKSTAVMQSIFGISSETISEADAIKSATSNQEELTEAVKDTEKAVKKTLAGFDDLQILAGSASEEASKNSLDVINADTTARETTAQETKDPARNVDASPYEHFFDTILKAIKPVIDATKEWISTLDFSNIKGEFEGLKSSLKSFGGVVQGVLYNAYTKVLLPLSGWYIEEGAPAAIDALTKAFDGLKKILSPLWEGLKKLFDELTPAFDWIGETALWAIQELGDMFSSVGDVFEEKGEKIEEIFEIIGEVALEVWNAIEPMLNWAKDLFEEVFGVIDDLVADAIDIFYDFASFISNIFKGDWEAAWNSIVGVFKGVVNSIIGALNSLIRGLNSISFSLPDWDILGSWAGKSMGINIPEIPKLAQGTVIPPNKEFMAVLGDNTKEHEIVSPVSTMKQAFMEAMLEMGGNFGGGNTEVVLEIDGREFGRAVVEQGNRENRRIGTRLVIA